MIEEELDLRTLPDEELVEQMHDDVYDGLAYEIAEGTNILLERGWSASEVLNDALVEGMRIVGIDFRDGILFVPEVLLAANAMKAGMAILRPLLAETGAETVGKIVIGTVKGDIHDIGKNLVAMMMEGGRVRGHRPRDKHRCRRVSGSTRPSPSRYSRDVGSPHDHHAVHESGRRHPGQRGV